KTLYLENIGTTKLTLIDSLKIAGDGSFRFRYKRPETPDFYRLRLNAQVINLCVDSTETIRITGNAENFARDYTIEGSPESEKIKELTLLQLTANREYNRLQKQYETREIAIDEYVTQINKTVEDYKTEARKYIYSNPLSPSAYFALFQQINRLLIFDPYDKTDAKAYGAVANSWNQYFPESPRSVQLYQLFTQSLAVLRGERPIEITEKNARELFDITLPAPNAKDIRLSEIGDGKFTLIDFTAYGMKESPAHNILLAEIYNRYHSKGFEIYQISIDTDEHFWKNASVNLPWICVRDPQSVYSPMLKSYNISEIPTAFLRNREGDIVARIESDKDLEKEIGKYLR
ncbi:MAG: AhpC/TSA family protein, partial [Dysgonamonadaceae bacterium]|nr:AhpC/TSA family protein [Dysgonamonadaceae bacterium]